MLLHEKKVAYAYFSNILIPADIVIFRYKNMYVFLAIVFAKIFHFVICKKNRTVCV